MGSPRRSFLHQKVTAVPNVQDAVVLAVQTSSRSLCPRSPPPFPLPGFWLPLSLSLPLFPPGRHPPSLVQCTKIRQHFFSVRLSHYTDRFQLPLSREESVACAYCAALPCSFVGPISANKFGATQNRGHCGAKSFRRHPHASLLEERDLRPY